MKTASSDEEIAFKQKEKASPELKSKKPLKSKTQQASAFRDLLNSALRFREMGRNVPCCRISSPTPGKSRSFSRRWMPGNAEFLSHSGDPSVPRQSRN